MNFMCFACHLHKSGGQFSSYLKSSILCSTTTLPLLVNTRAVTQAMKTQATARAKGKKKKKYSEKYSNGLKPLDDVTQLYII
jgi:hypothetical protein